MTIVTRQRHLAKAISYRIIGTITTMSVSWYVTGNILFGLEIGIAESFMKIGIYYLHERLWLKSKFGIKK